MHQLVNEDDYALPGDDRIGDAAKQFTRALTIGAPIERVWPELTAMVSARIEAGCAVLASDPPRSIVIGGLFDHDRRIYLPFEAPRPTHFWQATWALILTPIDRAHTRLEIRTRVAFTSDAVQWAAVWTHPFSDFSEHEELAQLKRRAEATSR